MRFKFGDTVRITTRKAAYWAFNSRTGKIAKIPNRYAQNESGEAMQIYEVEVIEPDGEPRVIDVCEDELVPWNGIDRMFSLIGKQ